MAKILATARAFSRIYTQSRLQNSEHNITTDVKLGGSFGLG
ncbi:hypothetical protein JMJ77_0003014, partial [Colletotrichum scovillei]